MADGMPTEDEQALEDYKFYLEERKLLIAAEQEAAKSYDQFMITLSSGALGLTILYLEKVAPHPRPATYPWLVAAWVCFALTLCVMLGSFLMSQSSFRRQRKLNDREQRLADGPQLPLPPPSALSYLAGEHGPGNPWPALITRLAGTPNPWSDLTSLLNLAGYVLFVIGVLTFALFSYLNLPTQENDPVARSMKPPLPPDNEGRGMGAPDRPVPPPRPGSQPAPKPLPPPPPTPGSAKR